MLEAGQEHCWFNLILCHPRPIGRHERSVNPDNIRTLKKQYLNPAFHHLQSVEITLAPQVESFIYHRHFFYLSESTEPPMYPSIQSTSLAMFIPHAMKDEESGMCQQQRSFYTPNSDYHQLNTHTDTVQPSPTKSTYKESIPLQLIVCYEYLVRDTPLTYHEQYLVQKDTPLLCTMNNKNKVHCDLVFMLFKRK